jgi:hypothetical protein
VRARALAAVMLFGALGVAHAQADDARRSAVAVHVA